jgi:membrane associated rhomboid family serine protease
MIPIRDDAPRAVTPYVTYTLIALNTLIFLFEVSLPGEALNRFLFQFGVVPALYTQGQISVVPLLSSTFLHGGWWHLIINMWALYIFGDNIEDYLGGSKYLLLYLAAGIAGSLAHIFFNPGSQVPSVGASGAIAGVMGAYFLLFPAARVLTVLPVFFFCWFVWLPAWVVLGFWFLGQFLNGAAAAIAQTSSTISGGGIAFWAHVGGFLAGAAAIKLFRPRAQRYLYS